jgi:aminoglycoside phosphotransferase (APT) family kinase protein
MVLSWCSGSTLLSALETKPWAVWRLSRLFGRTQARIHAVSPPGEFQATAPDCWTMRVAARYPDLAAEIRALEPTRACLIHLDFHPLNVIIEGGRLSGVIDWGGAAAGDPRADLARTAVTMLTAPLPPGPMRVILDAARRLALRGWRSGYEEEAGPMPDHDAFTAWAAATLLLEIERVVDRPGVWGTQKDIERLRSIAEGGNPPG